MISATLWHPIRQLRAQVAAWWLRRLPLTDRVTLNQHNVYILPTRAGLMLALTLAVLLVGSINYQLNLGYLLTFLLAGCALVAMHVSHGTLRGLTLHLDPPEPIYAGDKAILLVHLHNLRRRPRYAIAVAVQGAQQWVVSNVAAQASASLQLAFAPERRGWQPLPPLTAQTLFPIGTFRVWTLWRPAARVLVYPRPEHNPPALPGDPLDGASNPVSHTQPPGEPDGVRPYRRGDTLKSIVWKKAAQTGELVSRDSLARQAHELWLEPRHTGLSQPEPQLSRLCAWVLLAERLGLRYGLRLPAQQLAPDQGPAHQQRCLQALALV